MGGGDRGAKAKAQKAASQRLKEEEAHKIKQKREAAQWSVVSNYLILYLHDINYILGS